MKKLINFALLCGALVAACRLSADAQSTQDLKLPPPAPTGREQPSFGPRTTAGATIYVCDAGGNLWTVTLGTYRLHRIGRMGVVLTDLAFNPRDGRLWGVDFSSFYTVDPLTARTQLFGRTSLNDINALVFDRSGIGYFEGFQSPELYAVNLVQRRYVAVGQTGRYTSAGDLSFYNGALILAGQTTGGGAETIVKLNQSNGSVEATAATNLVNLYGLATVGGTTLYGFANASLYLIRPSEPNVNLRTVLLKNFASQGLGRVNGAAYRGDI